MSVERSRVPARMFSSAFEGTRRAGLVDDGFTRSRQAGGRWSRFNELHEGLRPDDQTPACPGISVGAGVRFGYASRALLGDHACARNAELPRPRWWLRQRSQFPTASLS